MTVMGERAAPARSWSTAGRISATVLLLVLPLACFALAFTAPDGPDLFWLGLGVVNLVLPALLLTWVWRREAPPS
jgi:Na+-driven multidrug efflux pump